MHCTVFGISLCAYLCVCALERGRIELLIGKNQERLTGRVFSFFEDDSLRQSLLLLLGGSGYGIFLGLLGLVERLFDHVPMVLILKDAVLLIFFSHHSFPLCVVENVLMSVIYIMNPSCH